MNRPDLMAMLGHRVTVANFGGSSWTGKLVAIGSEPCVTIDVERGTRMCLPQSFTVTRAEVAPDSDLVIHAYRHEWLNADATASDRTATRENALIGRLEAMLANLTAHIEQRAQELAQPLITAAEEERENYASLQQRAAREADQLRRRAIRAETAIARARSTIHLNTSDLLGGRRDGSGPTDYARGYKACADHITRALTTTQEADRG